MSPAPSSGLDIVLVVDLQGFLLYNIKQQGMTHFCPVVASLLDGRGFCITHPGGMARLPQERRSSLVSNRAGSLDV